MNSSLFSVLKSVLKIAVVCMMLVWAANRVQAQTGYPTCSNPLYPDQYNSCMGQCGQTQSACQSDCEEQYFCGTACASNPQGQSCLLCQQDLASCQDGCTSSFNSCATSCYNEYCI
jgi:hypothetical protein